MRSDRRASLIVKRGIDIVVSLAILAVCWPLLALAALAILVTSGPPVLYLAKRWGVGETRFTCFKLRTMHADQAARLQARGLAAIGADGRTLTHDDDPRIDRLGAFLRASSIDELPQLVNVVRGEMSLIGPRALALSMLADQPEIRADRSVMRPGITGLWQVRARRKNVSALDMADDDREYIRRFSLALDLEIALRTLPLLLGLRPAVPPRRR
jgi:exopolysaccharide production protein ExoY